MIRSDDWSFITLRGEGYYRVPVPYEDLDRRLLAAKRAGRPYVRLIVKHGYGDDASSLGLITAETETIIRWGHARMADEDEAMDAAKLKGETRELCPDWPW